MSTRPSRPLLAAAAALGLTAAALGGCGDEGAPDVGNTTATTGAQGGAGGAAGAGAAPGGIGGAAGAGGSLPPYPEPAMEGIIRGVDESFWANMDDFIFNVVEPSDVGLYVTVMTAAHYLAPEHRALGIELVRNPESLFANAVIPFLERYGSTGVIWAVDCMNEPEGLVAGADGNWDTWGATWDEMRAFLAYCAGAVHGHDPTLRVSAGSGWHAWDNVAAGRYLGLGFDFYDYHLYSDTPAPPAPTALGVDRPVVIGECGQATEVWDDDLQYDAVRACFAGARDAGYLAALSWFYDYPGSTNYHAHLDAQGSWRPVRDAFDEFVGDTTLEIGLNLAWLDGAYRHDFGRNPLYPSWSVAYEHAAARAVIDDYDEVGIGLMRLWLFEGQEALPYHAVFDDFEGTLDGWSVSDGQALSATTSHDHVEDGSFSLAIGFNATAEGWYGIEKSWSSEARLNLQPMTEWALYVTNELGREVGVNLAFVTNVGGTRTTYQTRSGVSGGQVWLADGAAAAQVVSLAAGDFADQWALDTSPGVGVARPPDDELQQVEQLKVRVYLSAASVPTQGELFVDAIRIR